MPRAAFLAFWQLGSAWMLLWGAAALLPILIHLWSRRRYQTTSWAAMTFLMAALRQNARRVRLEQWILLAVRTLLLLLFALALADPMFSLFSAWQGSERSGRTHTVIVLDASFSMDYRRPDGDGQNLFDAAKAYARRIIDESEQGDAFTLVLMADPPRVVIGQPAFDPSDVEQEMESLELIHTGASLPSTLAAVDTILRDTAEHHPRLSRQQVYFLSDMQQITWQDANSAEVRQRLGRMAERASMRVVDFGETGETNLAISRLEALQPISTTAGDTYLQAEVQSFGGPTSSQRVTLRIDGNLAAERRITVGPLERASVSFQHQFSQPGEHLVEVRLNDDALPIDNHRWLSVPVRSAIRVLCIEGRPDESQYVALALEPRPSEQARVRVERAAESALMETDLSPYDCLVLCNVGRFSPGEAAVLQRYVARGGGLIVFLGDQVQADSYNQLLGSDSVEAPVLPADLGAISSESLYRINPLDYRHPVVAPFRGHEKSGLLTTPIWTYLRLKPSENAKLALAFDNGDPLLVEGQSGQGRVLLFASAASPDSLNRTTNPPTPWTAISTWPSFPPLVQEMLNLAISGRSAGRNQTVGDELAGQLTTAGANTTVRLTTPSGASEQVPLVLDSQGAHWSYGGATKSGPYEVDIGPPVSTTQTFAVNVPISESNLERLPREMLPSQLSANEQAPDDESVPRIEAVSVSYFRELLLAVMGLLVVELMLAWRLGRGAA